MTILLAWLTLSFAAQAENLPIEDLKSLPPLVNPKILVIPGPRFATVQPTVWIEFNFRSCAQYSFQTEVIAKDSLMLVKVKVPIDQLDCHGPTIKRVYSYQLAADFTNESYILLNPLRPELRRSN